MHLRTQTLEIVTHGSLFGLNKFGVLHLESLCFTLFALYVN